MINIIDYRNARYQGQTYNGLPDGLGIIFDCKNMFCIAEWVSGSINGKCIIVFGDSKIFYGQIKNQTPYGVCTYHLKDKCQIFCNFLNENNSKNNNKKSVKSLSSSKIKSQRLIALLPTFNMIIKVQGQNQDQLQIKQQYIYQQGGITQLQHKIQQMLSYTFRGTQFQSFLTLQSFLYQNFYNLKEYKQLLDISILSRQQGSRQINISYKKNKSKQSSSLGIKIINTINNKPNIHNDTNSYIVQSVGNYNKEGLLEFGQKMIKTLIKGSVKQQAIYINSNTIIRYEQNQRPQQCSNNIIKYLKQSIDYNNQYIPLKYLSNLQQQCFNINFNIKQVQTKRHAQLVLQNPRPLTIQQKQQIQNNRNKSQGKIKKNNNDNKKNINNQIMNPLKRKIQQNRQKTQILNKTKQQIYRSVSKKKLNTSSSITNININMNQSIQLQPNKQLKPSQLSNIKPLYEKYMNTPQKSFYNSITHNNNNNNNNNNNSNYSYKQQLNEQGYKYNKIIQMPYYDDNKYGNSYVQNNNNINKTPSKYKYVDRNNNNNNIDDIINRRIQRSMQRNIDQNYDRSIQQLDTSIKQRKKYRYTNQYQTQKQHQKKYQQLSNSRRKYQQLSNSRRIKQYDYYYPTQYQHNFNNNLPEQQNYYDSQKHIKQYFKSKSKSKSKSPNDQMNGKFGRRVIKKPKQNYYQNYQNQKSISTISPLKQKNKRDPIIVPELKINANNLRINNDKQQVIPRRQHHLKNQQFYRKNTSPLKSQKYRQQLSNINNPIKNRYPQIQYNKNNLFLYPTINIARSQQNLKNNYLQNINNDYSKYSDNKYNKMQMRNKSPNSKKYKILHQNPFQLI